MINIRNRRGSIFLVTLLTGTILLILLAALISWLVLEFGLTSKSYASTAAIASAEAGVEMGIWELNYNSSAYASPWTDVTDGTGTPIPNMKRRAVSGFATSAGQSVGDFVVTVSNIGGIPVTIEATGYYPSSASIQAQRTVKVRLDHHVFNAGLFSDGNLGVMNDTFSDSYDSANGPYSVAPHGTDGDIASNGNLSFGNGCTINGDATPGPTGTVTIGAGSTVAGSTAQLPFSVPLDSVVIPAGLASSGDLTTATTLTQGIYRYSSISLGGIEVLTIPTTNTGPVIIYVDGDIHLNGNVLTNTSGIPTNLQIYSTGSSVMFNGNPTICASIYAPDAAAQVVGAGVVIDGALVVDSFTGTNHITIHHDLACRRINTAFSKYTVYAWQEM